MGYRAQVEELTFVKNRDIFIVKNERENMGSDSNRFLFWKKMRKFLLVFLVLVMY